MLAEMHRQPCFESSCGFSVATLLHLSFFCYKNGLLTKRWVFSCLFFCVSVFFTPSQREQVAYENDNAAFVWCSLILFPVAYKHVFILCFLHFIFIISLCPQAQLIAQSIGQAFSVAYQEFLRANGINPEDLSQKEYSDIINTQEMYNDDLIHFSNSENCKEVGPYEACSVNL